MLRPAAVRAKLALAALLTLPILACTETLAEPGDPAVGTYMLRSVNGASLPYTLAESGPERVSLTAGDIRLSDDGSVSHVIRLGLVEANNPYAGGVSQHVATGVWSRSGDAIQITLASGVIATGTVGDGSLVLVEVIKEPIDGNQIRSVDQSVSMSFRR